MKLNVKTLIISTLLVAAPLFMFAQVPPLPGDNNPNKPTDPKNVVGGAGAPIGNGTLILLTLAAAYATRKVYELKTSKEKVTG